MMLANRAMRLARHPGPRPGLSDNVLSVCQHISFYVHTLSIAGSTVYAYRMSVRLALTLNARDKLPSAPAAPLATIAL